MCLIYKCVICGKDIPNPRVNQETCDGKECRRKYGNFYTQIFRRIYKERMEKYNKAYRLKNKAKLKKYHHGRYLKLKKYYKKYNAAYRLKMRKGNGLGK